VGQWGVGLMSLAVASISLFIVRGGPVVYVLRRQGDRLGGTAIAEASCRIPVYPPDHSVRISP